MSVEEDVACSCGCSCWLGVLYETNCSSGCSSLETRPLVNLQQMLRPFFSVLQSPLCAPVSLILSLSPLQMSRCQPFESNPPLQSFIQACAMWAVCAASPALAVPLAFIYAASVNIHLYPTAADDISSLSSFCQTAKSRPHRSGGSAAEWKP